VKPICVYHGNCADGFGAAWVLHKQFGEDIDFYAGHYQRTPPMKLFLGRDVFFVDFCYKREVMREITKHISGFLLILDHHKSAMENMAPNPEERIYRSPYPETANWVTFLEEMSDGAPGDIYSVFDMSRSGAGIAWDFFNPEKPRPRLIDHIEDRDLWKFQLAGTREIQANLFSYPYDFDLWSRLMIRAQGDIGLGEMIVEGQALERKHHKDIHELVEVVTKPMRFRVAPHRDPERAAMGFYETKVVPAANLPYTLTSDAGHLLCRRNCHGKPPPKDTSDSDVNPYGLGGYVHPFAACYWDKPDGRQFSLRSQDDGYDVAKIAEIYGGGGHARASGFTVPYNRLAEFEP
jgi:oligoribonuclease NrnB/cAMP/cGMP phosphodiesterase (DHH superfamily)